MAEQESNSQNPKPKSRALSYIQLFLVIGIIVVALVLARAPERVDRASFSVDRAEAVQPRTVDVLEQPQTEKFTLQVEKTGNVNLDERVAVRTEAKGRIVWVSENFQTGRTIAADEVFVKIDPTEYQLRVDEADALLQIAKSKQESMAQDPEKDMSGINARIQLLETRLEMAQFKLEKSEISLPYEFRVIRADIEVGELVGPHEYAGSDAALLGTGYRLESLIVSTPIETQLLKDLEPAIGRGATITVGGETYRAKIDLISPIVAPETRLITVFLRFDESIPKEDLPLPGMFADISFDGPSYDNVYALPLEAMAPNRQIWVIQNGVVDTRSPVTVAITDENWIVESFDTAEGLVVGSYPGLSMGDAVTVNKLQ